MRHLQQAFEDFREKGLVLVGINCSDDLEIAREFLSENGATFPNVLDDSAATKKTVYTDYQTLSMSAVPMSYVIDREGKVASRWYGRHRGSRIRALLRRFGIE